MTDPADFTRTAAALVAANDRLPTQRVDSEAPYKWFDPEWVRVEATVFAADGSITRSEGWVRREEFFRNGPTSGVSEKMDE